jgi:hypothetical protein
MRGLVGDGGEPDRGRGEHDEQQAYDLRCSMATLLQSAGPTNAGLGQDLRRHAARR